MSEKTETPHGRNQEREGVSITGKIPIKTFDRDKSREEAIIDNNIENLFLKEPVILENLADDQMDRINMFSGNASMFKEKNKMGSPDLPSKNNFLENQINKYNINLFKKKNNELESGITIRRSSIEISSNIKPNKSYVIEKENEEVSPTSNILERKNYSTLVHQVANIEKDEEEAPKSHRNKTSDLSKGNSKSNDNITEIIKKDHDINESFKTVKSDNVEEREIQFINRSETGMIHYIKK